MTVLANRYRLSSPKAGVPAKDGWTWHDIAVALLMFSTFATFRRREIWQLLDGSGFDAEIKFKVVAWLVLGLLAATQWRMIARNSYLLLRAPLLLFFLFWLLTMVSTIYSLSPSLTMFRSTQLGIVLAFGLILSDKIHQWPKLAEIYLAVNWLFLAVGLTGLIEGLNWRDLPSYQEAGFDYFNQPWRFGTPVGHFSVISIVATMTLLALCSRMRGVPSFRELVLTVWLAATVLLTVSRTAIAGLVVGLLILLVLRGMLMLALLAIALLSAPLLAFPPVLQATLEFLSRGQTAEELESLTNRTSIYDSALATVRENWLLGIGYRATRAVVLDQQADGSGVGHSHNAVLEAAVGLGVGGALLALLLLISVVGCAFLVFRSHRWTTDPCSKSRGAEFMALTAPVLAFSMLDSSFAIDVGPFILVFVAVLVDLTRSASRIPVPSRLNRSKEKRHLAKINAMDLS